jgi:hypothetical protein
MANPLVSSDDGAYKTSAASLRAVAFARSAVREISSAAATLMTFSPAEGEQPRSRWHSVLRWSHARSRAHAHRALQRAAAQLHSTSRRRQRENRAISRVKKTTCQSEKSDFSLGNAFFLQ